MLYVILLVGILCSAHVYGCFTNCTDKPVLTPSRLVVKHGDPVAAKCSVCEDCVELFGLEVAFGERSKNETTISWKAPKMTEWEPTPFCYYTIKDSDDQCCTFLPITVYQPPDNVSISFENHTGPMFEGHQYTLQCEVQKVAPIKNLIVTLYKGQTILDQQFNDGTDKKPVTKTFMFNIIPTKDHDGAQYWCEAKLELGPEGPQPPPVVTSQNITASVHYKPQLQGSPHSQMTIKAGSPLLLNCSAWGNPSPSYWWTRPSGRPQSSNSNILTIESETSADGGLYTCSVSNSRGTVTVEFDVTVEEPPDNVSISFKNHTGPMFDGHQYTLQCEVQKVAPIKNLTVTLYKGQTVLDQQFNNGTDKKPVTKTFNFDIIPTKDDDGAQYWCEAKLELGPEGPQPPPVVTSQNITASVHYKPQLQGSPHSQMTIKAGSPLLLNCSAWGNPSPSYSWTRPSGSPHSSNSNILTIDSVTSADGGLYTCSVSNSRGTVTVEFNVTVEAINIIVIVVIVAVVVCLLGLVYWRYYRTRRMGKYTLQDVFRLSKQHTAVPITE